MLFFLGLCDQECRTIKSVEQKKFYGSLESRKLSFFSMQMGEGLFYCILDHSGKWTSLDHFSERQTVGIVPTVIWTRSPHTWLLQLFNQEHASSYNLSWNALCVCTCVCVWNNKDYVIARLIAKRWFLTKVNWAYRNYRPGWRFTRNSFCVSFAHIGFVSSADKARKMTSLIGRWYLCVTWGPGQAIWSRGVDGLCIGLFYIWPPVSRAKTVLYRS